MFELVDVQIDDDPLAELTPQEFRAVQLYFSGGFRTVSSIAKIVKLHPGTVTKILNKDCVQDLWKRLREMYYQDMAMNAVKGSEIINTILHDDKASYSEQLKAIGLSNAAVEAAENKDATAQKGRSVSLSETVGAIIEEAMKIGRNKMISDDIINYKKNVEDLDDL